MLIFYNKIFTKVQSLVFISIRFLISKIKYSKGNVKYDISEKGCGEINVNILSHAGNNDWVTCLTVKVVSGNRYN